MASIYENPQLTGALDEMNPFWVVWGLPIFFTLCHEEHMLNLIKKHVFPSQEVKKKNAVVSAD